jgi:hypothetical protein
MPKVPLRYNSLGMKTQILQLESHDDLISVRDRMAWAKTPRILLVWPRHEKVSLRTVDLAILQHHATALGAQLGLVTRDAEMKRAAAELALPVFESLPEAQLAAWEEESERIKPQRRGPRPDLPAMRAQVGLPEAVWRTRPAVRIGFFALGVLAVLVVAAGFLPQASLILTPVRQTQDVTIRVSANPNVNVVYLSGSIPAHEVTLTVDGNRSITSTGSQDIPAGRAQGVVRFKNLTESAVSVPTGTIVRTLDSPALRFETTIDAVLDAGIGETVDVPMQAVNPGAESNVEAGQIQAIEGDLGLQISVSNPDPVTGGNTQNLPAPSESDKARLRTLLLADLQEQALSKLRASGSEVFTDSLRLSQVIEEKFDPAEGQPGSKLMLSMQVEYLAYAASTADLQELAVRVLGVSVPQGFSPVADTLHFEMLNQPKSGADGLTRFDLRASQTVQKELNLTQAIHLVQGRRPENALAQLRGGLSLAAPPQIKLAPSWWPWLPVAPFRISVVTR